MTTLVASTFGLRLPAGFAGSLRIFAIEAFALIDALFNPRKLIAEVEEMRTLQLQATRIEARDPEAAAALRRRASHIGLR